MYRPPKGLTVETALGVPRDISNSVYVVREDKYPQTTDFCSSLPFSLIMENVGGGALGDKDHRLQVYLIGLGLSLKLCQLEIPLQTDPSSLPGKACNGLELPPGFLVLPAPSDPG